MAAWWHQRTGLRPVPGTADRRRAGLGRPTNPALAFPFAGPRRADLVSQTSRSSTSTRWSIGPAGGRSERSGPTGLGRAEVRTPAGHGCGHLFAQHVDDFAGTTVGVDSPEEQQHARPPVVIGRPRGVVAKHLRAGAQKRRGVNESGKSTIEDGPDGLSVGDSGERQAVTNVGTVVTFPAGRLWLRMGVAMHTGTVPARIPQQLGARMYADDVRPSVPHA